MAYAGASGPAGGVLDEPAAHGLTLEHEHGRSVSVRSDGAQLLRYVHHPWDPQLESPRPYVHPLRTLGGSLVSLYRPHDHVWHKGLALSLPNVGDHNFWGGPTYTRGHGYRQLDNDGSMEHRGFEALDAGPGAVTIAHALDWVTADGRTVVTERRRLGVTVPGITAPGVTAPGITAPGVTAPGVTVPEGGDAWVLTWGSELTNTSGADLAIGSPATQGREGAGYAGLFWRGPRSWTGGTVLAPGRSGADDLNGVRAPWLGFTGRHDEGGGASTVVFATGGEDVPWFVRTEVYACLCPAPFSEAEVVLPDAGRLALRSAVVVADGERDSDGAEELAALGAKALAEVAP